MSFLPWCFFSSSFHNFPLYLHNLFFISTVNCLIWLSQFLWFLPYRVFSFILSLNYSTSTQTGNALCWNKGFHDMSIASIPSFSKQVVCFLNFYFSTTLPNLLCTYSFYIPGFLSVYTLWDHSPLLPGELGWLELTEEEGSAFSCTPMKMDHIHPMHLNLT